MTAQPIKKTLPPQNEFMTDVINGLTSDQKTLPCKYFYDEAGSKIYDKICELEEYYPTRTEIAIVRKYVKEITAHFNPDSYLIEYGSGSSIKTRTLLDKLKDLDGYSPIDISGEHLKSISEDLHLRYPDLAIYPIEADYTQDFDLPEPLLVNNNRIVYYPGSSLGNFTQEEAIEILTEIRELAGPNGKLLIGIDLVKPIPILEAAYNDKEGVTAEFNLNLLTRINKELDGDFDLAKFKHRAIFNQDLQRIEMHLISLTDQVVNIGDHSISFKKSESIHTENSHKYSLNSFGYIAKKAGWENQCSWTDDQSWFSVQLLN